MPPFVMKVSFYAPGKNAGAKNAAHAKYIATRPGADRGENIIKPDSAAGHVKYAAERPRSHGIFSSEESQPDLDLIQDELLKHNGVVWRFIVSLREDDAVRLGYVERSKWETTLRSLVSTDISEKMGIKVTNLRWVAAFHQEKGHPHVHLVLWEKEPKRTRGVLSNDERREIKKCFIKQIYAEERARLGIEKSAIRDFLRDTAKENTSDIKDVIKDIRSYRNEIRALNGDPPGVPPRLYDEDRAALIEKIEQIADILPGKGRVALKFMLPEVKEKLHEVADWMLRQPGFSKSVGRYVEIARELAGHYSSDDDTLDKSGRNAYEDLRDRLSQNILKCAVEIGKLERVGATLDGDMEPFESESTTIEIKQEISGPISSGTKLSGTDVKEVSEKLVKDAWRIVDRAVFRLEPDSLRGKTPAFEIEFKKKVAGSLQAIVGHIPEDALKGRIALAYLPREVKDEVRSLAGQLLQSEKLESLTEKYVKLAEGGNIEGDASEVFRELKERVAEQVVNRAAELLPREIPRVKMLIQKERVADAINRLNSATFNYICGDKKESEWTARTMYRALTRLGVDSSKVRETSVNWARGAGLEGFEKFVDDNGEDKSKQKHISRKDWTKLRENLGLEEEECLYPWFGVQQVTNGEQSQDDEQSGQDEQVTIPHELVEGRVVPAVSALEAASWKPDNYAEVNWTVRIFTNTLQSLGVGDEERGRIVREWVERSGLEISDARLRDVLDRVTVAPREDFWLGRAGWVRLSVNLGVTTPAAAPWRVTSERTIMGADKNKVAGELWRDAWHASERAIYRLNPGVREKTPNIEDYFGNQVAGKLEAIAVGIPEDALKGRLTLAYMPQEVKDEARGLADQLLKSGKLALRTEKYIELVDAGQGEASGSEAYHELRERVAEQVIGRAAELLPREIPQVEMLPHNGRVQDGIERLKSASAEYIRGDIDEANWTAGAMYRALVRLGEDAQSAREVTEKWGDSVGLKEETARAVTGEIIKMECIAQECREDNKPEPVHVSRKDWTRLRENLGLEEEECLYPWFGIMHEKEQLPEEGGHPEQVVIPHELIEKRISPALGALETASGKPEDYAEVQWTVRTLASTLQALGVGEEDRGRIVREWAKRSGLEVPEARLSDVLDRITVVPKEDFWLGRAGWKRLMVNLDIHNPPVSPWRVNVERYGNMLWKTAWQSVERERLKAEAMRDMEKHSQEVRRQNIRAAKDRTDHRERER